MIVRFTVYIRALLKKHTVLRYLISGGSAAMTNLLLYLFLERVLGIYYVFSSILAFCVAFYVSFLLQKFWTFDNHDMDTVRQQGILYLFVVLSNLALGSLGLYLLVEYVHLYDVVAWFIVNAILAIVSFFIYKYFVFHTHADDVVLDIVINE